MKTTFNRPLQEKGMVLVMYCKRRQQSAGMAARLQQNTTEKIFPARIHRNVKLTEASWYGRSTLDYDSLANRAPDYLALAKAFSEI